MPYRTFKTDRDREAAKARNPSLVDRIKNKFFTPKEATGPVPLTSEKLKSMYNAELRINNLSVFLFYLIKSIKRVILPPTPLTLQFQALLGKRQQTKLIK